MGSLGLGYEHFYFSCFPAGIGNARQCFSCLGAFGYSKAIHNLRF